MPNGWTIVGTPDELRDLFESPHRFGKEIEKRVAAAGAGVDHIFWNESDPTADPPVPRTAYVLTKVPKHDANAVFDRLDEQLGPTTRLYDEFEEIERRGGEAD
jgi:hypothetical protein